MGADWKLDGVTVCTNGSEQLTLLNDIQSTFKAGQITLLVGHNGAGKSTLLETMSGLRPIREGVISLGQAPLWVMTGRKKKLNRDVIMELGISLQNSESQWFAASVREEFLYSLKPYGVSEEVAEQRIAGALDRVGLSADLLGRDPWTLSGGQQRRLSLACLLACQPEWLLLDEPTAGLDAAGIRRLCAVLEAHRAAGGGAVVATHDLDALLPLADAVAVVSGGTVREAASAAAAAHAAAAPKALRALAEQREEAAMPPLESVRSGGAPWPAPREVAAALAAELLARTPGTVRGQAVQEAERDNSVSDASQYYDRIEQTLSFDQGDVIRKEVSYISQSAEQKRSSKYDPRIIVIAYILLASGVLALKTFFEVAIGAMMVLLLLIPFRELIYPWIKVIRIYFIMIVIFCVIGGLSLDPLSFNWEIVWPILIRFSKLLLIMLLGMPMLKLMTPLRLQRAIEQTLGWLRHLRVPIHSFALIVTLIFRFIPLLMGEWERFAKLAHARGKASAPLKTVPLRMLHAVLIPYVRSILRLAEGMADALEARGYGYSKRNPTYGFRLHFGRSDAKLFVIAAISSLLLFLLAAAL